MKQLTENDLPELVGSVKQIKWAKDIRVQYLDYFNKVVSYDFAKPKTWEILDYDEEDQNIVKREKEYEIALERLRPISTLNNDLLKKSTFTGQNLKHYEKYLNAALVPELSSSSYEESIEKQSAFLKETVYYIRADRSELDEIIDKIATQMTKDWEDAYNCLDSNMDKDLHKQVAYRNFLCKYGKKTLLENASAAWWISMR